MSVVGLKNQQTEGGGTRVYGDKPAPPLRSPFLPAALEVRLVNAAEFDRLEQQLGITLPRVYREIFASRPHVPGAIARQIALVEDVEELVAINRECRRSGFAPTLFAIGFAENAAVAYGLDVSREPQPVVAMGLNDRSLVEQATDLEAWIAELAQGGALQGVRSGASTPVGVDRRPNGGWLRFWKR